MYACVYPSRYVCREVRAYVCLILYMLNVFWHICLNNNMLKHAAPRLSLFGTNVHIHLFVVQGFEPIDMTETKNLQDQTDAWKNSFGTTDGQNVEEGEEEKLKGGDANWASLMQEKNVNFYFWNHLHQHQIVRATKVLSCKTRTGWKGRPAETVGQFWKQNLDWHGKIPNTMFDWLFGLLARRFCCEPLLWHTLT